MRYAIAPVFGRNQAAIPISAEEYVRIAEAKDALVATIGIEQKFDLLLENYVEYEAELLTLALHQVAFRNWQWQAFQREGLTVTRRLANLLSAARLYVDQVAQDLGGIFGKDHEIVAAVKQKCSAEYDASLGFRLMEALRNTLQHRSISAIRLKYETAVDSPEHRGIRSRAIPLLSTSDLRECRIKASVQRELEHTGEYVQLTKCVREYMDGLAAVHYEFRQRALPDRQRWESTIREVHAQGVERWEGEASRPSDLVAIDPSGAIQESRHIFLEPIDYLIALETKNAGPLKLTRMYVSGACEDDA